MMNTGVLITVGFQRIDGSPHPDRIQRYFRDTLEEAQRLAEEYLSHVDMGMYDDCHLTITLEGIEYVSTGPIIP